MFESREGSSKTVHKPGACLRAKSKYAGGGYGRGYPLPYVRKKIKICTKSWPPLHFLNLNTDLIVSKIKVKSSQNPFAFVQDYYKIGILVM